MALGDLVPLTPIAPRADSGTPRGTPAATGSAMTTVVPPAPESEEARASAARVTRAQGVVQCRQSATSRQMYGLLAYLAALMLFAVYSLFSFWPRPTPNEQIPRGDANGAASATRNPLSDTVSVAPARSSAATADSASIDACDARQVADLLTKVRGDSLRSQLIGICYFGAPRIIWKETQLVLLVLFGGGVGAVLSCLRKSTLHFYKGDLCAEGLPGLYVWPFSGALTALVFYAFIRGGFFSGQSTIAQTSPYSFIAAALLSGMFTHEAVAKLRQLAETLLTQVNSRPTVPAPGTPTTGGESGSPPPASTASASPPGTVG